MAFATVRSCTLSGVNAIPITVEVHTAGGLPSVSLVGLPQSAVRESKDRVRAAIQNVGFEFPLIRITVNLAPADLPKQGGRFDLPIALGIMLARGYIPAGSLDDMCVVGELGLDGRLRGVSGLLPIALSLRSSNTTLLCPSENLAESTLSETTAVIGANTLSDVVMGLKQLTKKGGFKTPSNFVAEKLTTHATQWSSASYQSVVIAESEKSTEKRRDFSDVKGHSVAKRVLEIAAAGEHNVLLVGPPGTGKSMLANRFTTLLPPMNEAESLEAASIASIRNDLFDVHSFGVRAFRSPHHTVPITALIGGGYKAMPGEISLAHRGVLFLDEMSEFPRHVLDALREPMESGCVHLSRLGRGATYPSCFQLLGASNPCPCGYYGDPKQPCCCTLHQLETYRARLSGPLLDRIDLHVTVERTTSKILLQPSEVESSHDIQQRVNGCRQIQLARQGYANQRISESEVLKLCCQNDAVLRLINSASEKFNLSHRAVHRTLRVARTVADLAGANSVEAPHVTEALTYRLPSN